MKKILPIFLLVLLAGILTGKEVKIDLKNAVISAPTRYRATALDLKKHLELMGGGSIALVGEKMGNSLYGKKFVFYLDKAPAGKKYSYKGEEGYYTVTEKALYFHGDKPSRNNSGGVSHAVYLFLEEALGVRWINFDDIVYKKANPLVVSKLEGSYAPSLNIRGIRGTGRWGTRMRFGRHDPPQYGHAFTKWWKLYSKTHPDYFALNYGHRVPCTVGNKENDDIARIFAPRMAEAIALCVSNPKVVKQIIANWDKKSPYINICENDAPDELSCHCKNCMALDVLTPAQQKNWLHALADRYIYFANAVLKEGKKYKKDVKVSMYAYNASQDAPRKIRPHKDVVLGIVPTDFTKAGLQKYVGDWKKMGMNTFFYRPNRHYYYSYIFPCGFEKYFFEVFQYLHKEGAIGFDYDADNKYYNPTRYFSDYIIAKGMQDPSKPFEHWENHYLSGYGKAAPYVKQYFHYWRKEVWEKRLEKAIPEIIALGKVFNFGRGLYWNLGKYYKESDFVKSGKFLEQALQQKLTPAQRVVTEKLKNYNDHAHLTFRAVANKKDEDSIALLRYRQKHKIPLLPWNEQYYGDVCGIKRVMDFAAYTPPYVQTPLFWRFRLDPKDQGVKEKWFADGRKIYKWKELMPTNAAWEKPYKHYKFPSAELRKKIANYNGLGWYATSIAIPENWKDRKIYLYFGAVDESAWVYVNGKKAGERLFKNPDDWTKPFAIEITKCIDWKKPREQFVVVRVKDTAGAGGIWKRVWLVSRSAADRKQ